MGSRATHDSCLACGSEAMETATGVREMMFGAGEMFTYGRCADCTSLTLRDPPADLAPYYPADYYSFGDVRLTTSPGRTAHRILRLRSQIYRRTPEHILRALVHSEVLPLRCPPFIWWLSGSNIGLDASICDVGAGNGATLAKMSLHGYTNLTGIDPFMTGSARQAGPVRLLPETIQDVAATFDLIMFNHSLEHIPDPVDALRAARQRIHDEGRVLVRIPVADSYADRRFGAHWVAIDAPRHLFIPSVRGVRRLAQRAGLQIRRVFFDSTALQFWGSMLYLEGISLKTALNEGRSPTAAVNRRDAAVVRWRTLARRLNACGLGDTAGFLLSR